MLTYLNLGANVEEGKVARDQVVGDAGCLIKNIDLAVQDVFGLLEAVVSREDGSSLDFVESGCDICGRLGLGADGVEVGCDVGVACVEGDVLVAGALVDGEGDEVGGHWEDGLDRWFDVNSKRPHCRLPGRRLTVDCVGGVLSD